MIQKKEFVIDGKHGKPILVDVSFMDTNEQKPVVVFAHGFKGFKDFGCFNLIAESFAKEGFVFVKFNFSHNGTSIDSPIDFVDLEAFGNNNFSIELDDLGLVIDKVAIGELPIEAVEYDSNNISLIGHSRGGGIVVLKAAEDARVKKLITWASVSKYGRYWSDSAALAKWKADGVHCIVNGRTKQDMPLYIQLYENYIANENRLDIEKNAREISIPTLIIHGTEDPTVAVDDARNLHSLIPNSNLELIKDADHVFGGKHPWQDKELPSHTLELIDISFRFLIKK